MMYLNILRVVAGAGSLVFAWYKYKLQLVGKRSRSTANSTDVLFEEIRIRKSVGQG